MHACMPMDDSDRRVYSLARASSDQHVSPVIAQPLSQGGKQLLLLAYHLSILVLTRLTPGPEGFSFLGNRLLSL